MPSDAQTVFHDFSHAGLMRGQIISMLCYWTEDLTCKTYWYQVILSIPLPIHDSWIMMCYWHHAINQDSFPWNAAEKQPSSSQILLANLIRASNDTQMQVALHYWRFSSEHFLYSPCQDLFLNKAQHPSPTETCSGILHWVLPGAEVVLIWAGAMQPTSLHCQRSHENMHLVCWSCPVPQMCTCLQSDENGVVLGGREGGTGLSCCFPWVAWRVLGLGAPRQLTVLLNRRNASNGFRSKSQPNPSDFSIGVSACDTASLRKMTCSSDEEHPVPCCTFHAEILYHPARCQPAMRNRKFLIFTVTKAGLFSSVTTVNLALL